MSAAPLVPKRPARSPNRGPSSNHSPDVSQVPPRPQRAPDTTSATDREASTRSPLNASPFVANISLEEPTVVPQKETHLPRAPNVASLPLIGQEGIEYASLEKPQERLTTREVTPAYPKDPRETRNVADDLPLHAPKASAAPMTQKSRVAAVTRTDSEKASVVGIGKPKTEYVEPDSAHHMDPTGQYRPPSAVSTERPSSTQTQSLLESEQEQGIPTIGDTVPLYPNAGDVQAPTPAPGSAGFPPGELSRPATTEGHTRSAHGFHGPPGSYGLHGHGVVPNDKFEKAWYEKHPEELAKEEEGAHHPAAHDEKPAWALSSDELNKLVHESGRAISGMGTHSEMIGTPSEAIGYQATEEYASRAQSPQLTPVQSARTRSSRPSSQSYVESPLKKTMSASDYLKGLEAVKTDDDDIVHVVPPKRPQGKYSGAGYDPPTEDLGPDGGNTDEQGGWIDERGEGVPILASDEIKKHPAVEWMQPAISPAQQASEEEYHSAGDSDHLPSYRTSHSRSRSKGHSRPSSMHSHSGLSRFTTYDEGAGTPLEEIEEYEPLFNDDDTEETRNSKVLASKSKRPNLRQHHFPSRDIWEDTPNSLHLETTVETPEPVLPASATDKKTSAVFEPPEVEQLRKAEFIEPERQKVIDEASQDIVKPKFNQSLRGEMADRLGMRQRFPSRDIWEDTPDSLRLETTISDQAINVNATSPESAKFPASAQSKPSIPARPARSKPETGASMPAMPARPQAPDAPVVPDRQKPSVPLRPVRNIKKEPSEPSELSKVGSAESTREGEVSERSKASTVKAKPAAPAKPAASSKFASIKAGFMNDLNSRLSKGPSSQMKPQQEESTKEEEEEEEEEDKAPLSDARKGRARGPARRKPATSPTPAVATPSSAAAHHKLSFSNAWKVWSIDSSRPNSVEVNTSIQPKFEVVAPKTTASLGEQPSASPLATNTAGESLLSKTEAPETKAGHLAHSASAEMDARAHQDSEEATKELRDIEAERIGFEGDVPETIVDQPTELSPPSHKAEETLGAKEIMKTHTTSEDATISQETTTSPSTNQKASAEPLSIDEPSKTSDLGSESASLHPDQ